MQTTWNLIETAPMDGTLVLLTRAGTKMVCAGNWKKRMGWCGWIGHYYPPTHWMPLMELPKCPNQ